ncbi:hypothetical protein GCM10010124_16940 [Pilimelia terevasa]|uniref:Uncharacterized protein n=1 Tax=Pilimelia terevasa TaxID=53372 RepID=A0A8J3FIE8_9ACTN|nr:hypothetical protein [Pilimelia terevasa]GGK25016.1 hypothetical protein GCM10010124_16940 [Pilimelia terevasa]
MTCRIRSWWAALAGVAILLAATAGTAAAAPRAEPVFRPAAGTPLAAPAKLTHYQAYVLLRAAGIRVVSTGGCARRNRPTCTSLAQVNRVTVLGARMLRRASGCPLTVTGGTEVGHELPYPYRYTHWNGYKLDYDPSTCLNRYVQRSYAYVGGMQWRSASGNVYYRERDHWDVTYFNCGGC